MFENFPYSNFHDLNTDWLINKVKNVETSEANAKASEDNAKDSEIEAKASELEARSYASNAEQNAEIAAQSASDAQGYAIEAGQTVANTQEQVELLQARVNNIIPSGTQTEGNTELLDIRVGYNAITYSSAGDAVRKQVEDLHDAFDTLAVITPSPNLLNPDDVTNNMYINPNGSVETISGRTVTGFIPVNPGRKLTISSNGDWWTWASTCFYQSNKTTVVAGGTYNGYLLTVPANAYYVRVTYATSTYLPQIECNDTGTISAYQPYGDANASINEDTYIPNVKKWKIPFEKKTGDLSNGQFFKMKARTDVRKNTRVVFNSDITSFNSITIAKSSNVNIDNISNPRNVFVIDNTNITYKWDGVTQTDQQAHGLTISENIQVILEETDIATCKVTIISDGNSYMHTFAYRIYENGAFFVQSNNSVLTNCEFVWMCSDIDKLAWIFGDSYLQYATDRWAYYLHQYGYDKNALINAFAGEGSLSAWPSFGNLLELGTPKFAVWCLGMNDSSDTSESPSANWITGRDKFLKYCSNEHITPVFGTIPTVPTINNEMKNTWIRNSGYRYIDFAKAVGATSTGAWYSGMLSSDGIHPTVQGAKALFAQVLSDFPEIMMNIDVN